MDIADLPTTTFFSESNKKKLDYILIRCRHFFTVINSKIILYETIASQHRLLFLSYESTRCRYKVSTALAHLEINRIGFGKIISFMRLLIVAIAEKTWKQTKNMIEKAILRFGS